MNAPPDGKDSAWCNEVVVEFCSTACSDLDSPSYNDAPNQPPVTHRAGERALGKATAQQIVCCPSSFSTSEAAAVSLPMPTMTKGDFNVAPTPQFLTAILERGVQSSGGAEAPAPRREKRTRGPNRKSWRGGEGGPTAKGKSKIRGASTGSENDGRGS